MLTWLHPLKLRSLQDSRRGSEIWLEVTSGELTQADAARKWGVDVATIIKLRKDAKDACLSTFTLSRPGRRARERDHEIEELHRENARLAEAVKELAVELTLVRGKPKSWA